MLGLLQMLTLIDHHEGNALEIFRLSRSATQEFPFACVSINVTALALSAMRKGLLDTEGVRYGSLWNALDRFFVGLFYEARHERPEGNRKETAGEKISSH
jgi:hypothetical protein